MPKSRELVKRSPLVSGEVCSGSPRVRFFAQVEGREYELHPNGIINFETHYPRYSAPMARIEFCADLSWEALCAINNGVL